MSSNPKESAAAKDTGKDKEKKKGANKFADETVSAFVNTTPPGQLKDFSVKMADAYHPAMVEAAWDQWWEKCGFFKPNDEDNTSEKFVMVIPPPNVTGTLHIGHALTCTIEDAITRWNRMSGKNTIWLPGTDHAGIATQVVVEKQLARERNLTRHDLGREKFVEEVWKWKEQSGGRICAQLRKMGASPDWSREAFTMNPMLSQAVLEAFLRLHQRGLIYRSNRLVNWSCALRTAISSIEVDYLEVEKPTPVKVPGYSKPVEVGVIHSFAYKLTDGSGEIVVATTRIETMLGDVAVAVHPKDPRYTAMIGKTLDHPFVPNRKVVIIGDDVLVDMNFGTGAVKVTPAHDPNDFACGQRNKLPFINILTDDGLINEHGGKFAGQKRYEARETVIAELEKLGLYRGKAANKMSIGLCSRSKDIVEPVIRPQWWVNCSGMAKRACESVREGKLKILPEFHERTWFEWLENIQDWCISRQLWWGHRIPAYLVIDKTAGRIDDEAHWVVARTIEEARKIAAERFPNVPADQLDIEQDPDVLDTWFSSGLFPFATMGWPNNTPDFQKYYPGTLLETGHDILFFWVARMVMMGLELTDQLPFTTIYLHAMVRDKFGEKMSKSKGNVIDPLDIIEGATLDALCERLIKGNLDPSELQKGTDATKREYPEGIPSCGADALRFGLLAYSSQGRDVNLDVMRVVAYRQFGNKLWQATRFALMNFDEQFQPPKSLDEVESLVNQSNNFCDRWILSRLHAAVARADGGFQNYEFSEATSAFYNFWLYEFCDVYLEVIKPIVKSTDNPVSRSSSLAVLYTCLDIGLRLLHPMMPFISEELYHRLPGCNLQASIMKAQYPKAPHTERFTNAAVEERMKLLDLIGRTSRSVRNNVGLSGSKKKFDLIIKCSTSALAAELTTIARDISTIAVTNESRTISSEKKEEPPMGCINSVINADVELFFPLKGVVDFGSELVKMEKQMESLFSSIERQRATIGGPGFDKKPEDLKKATFDRLKSEEEEHSKLKENYDNFRSMMSQEEIDKFLADKKNALTAELTKAQTAVDKLKASLPPEKEKHPKKVLQKIAETEDDIAKITKKLAELK